MSEATPIPADYDSPWKEAFTAYIEEESKMPYITSVERIGRAEGEVDSKIADILTVLRERFGAVPAAVEERVQSTRDVAALSALLVRALRVDRPEDL